MATYYKAANGLEYLTKVDAELRGGGLVSKRTDMGVIEERVSLTKAEREEVEAKMDSQMAIRHELYGTFDAPTATEEVEPFHRGEGSTEDVEEESMTEEEYKESLEKTQEEVIETPKAPKKPHWKTLAAQKKAGQKKK